MLSIIYKSKIYVNKFLLISFIIGFILITKSLAEKHNEIKIGILLGFTGATENIAPSMADAAELAFKEILKGNDFFSNIKFKLIKADTTCNNLNSSKVVARELINDGVSAIIGAACPSITKAIAKEITIPSNIPIISPADRSNELLNLNDKGFVFRTTPSKIRGGKILADITKDRGIKKIAITYFNDEDSKFFANFYKDELNKKKIDTTIFIPHNRDNGDYTDHISALTAAGGDAVAVISNISVGGDQIIKSILDTGVFDKFILPEEMIDNKIISQFKQERLKKSFGYLQVFSNLGSKKFIKLAEPSGIDISNPFIAESYDAAAIIILSNFAKIYLDNTKIEDLIYYVSNKPGLKIYPGELKKAIKMLEQGKSINYEGVTGIEFDEIGDSYGSFVEVDISNGKVQNKKMR